MTTTSVRVSLGERSYPIMIGEGLLEQPRCCFPSGAERAAILTNSTIGPLYLDKFASGLRGRAWKRSQSSCRWRGAQELADAKHGLRPFAGGALRAKHDLDRSRWRRGRDIGGFARPLISAGFRSFKCPRRCWLKWTPQSVERLQSTTHWQEHDRRVLPAQAVVADTARSIPCPIANFRPASRRS